jgi:hypothetical protein
MAARPQRRQHFRKEDRLVPGVCPDQIHGSRTGKVEVEFTTC